MEEVKKGQVPSQDAQVEQNEKVLDASLLQYQTFKDESVLEKLIKMIECELSQPYSIYTYRYFVRNWKDLTIMAKYGDDIIGVLIGQLQIHKSGRNRGYVAMIVVKTEYRKLKIGKALTEMFINSVRDQGGDEIVLQTEAVNKAALSLYASLGFARVKRLMNYYTNGNDAFRLKLWLKPEQVEGKEAEKQQ